MPTQTADQHETTNIAIIYAVDQTWVINPGVTVSSRDNNAIFSGQPGSALINNGNLFSGAWVAVEFQAANASITNNGNIASFRSAILSNHFDHDIVNRGTIMSYDESGVEFGQASNGATLTNHGSIFGHAHGVFDKSASGLTINNFGLIQGDEIGVHVETSDGLTVINNAASGRIEGGGLRSDLY